MPLSPKTRRNLTRIVPFGVIWFGLAQVFRISDWAAVGSLADLPDTAIRVDPGIILFASLAVTVVGLMVGAMELLFLRDRFAGHGFALKIVLKTSVYSVVLLSAVLVLYPIAAAMEMNTGLLDGRVWDKLLGFLGSKTLISTGIQLGTSLIVSLFYAEMGEYMGHGVLASFISGKYHAPREETRIFMFSDMKGSTRITEQLGHARYFELLRSYYRDFSDPIVENGGEVYQYIGDEIVVSWPLEDGLRGLACVCCYEGMKQALLDRAGWYREHFGIAPDFKAGMHLGAVTTGEIGALKKEIVFTGDVLNATARIQALCSEYREDLLLSADLVEHLEVPARLEVHRLERQTLRGKTSETELVTLRNTPSGSVARG